MHRARPAIVAGVSAASRSNDLGNPDFADHNAVGSHSQGLPDKLRSGTSPRLTFAASRHQLDR